MHPLYRYWSLRTLVLVAPALVLASCVYRPVVMSNYDDASSFIELFAGIEGDRELQSAIDKNLMRVMRSGEQVSDWRESGVDMDGVLNAVPGGSAGNMLVSERADDVVLSSKQNFREFFGPEYTTYPVFGSDLMFASALDKQSFGLLRIGDGVWLEISDEEEKMGNASCSNTGAEAARLYTRRSFASLNKLEKSKLAAYVAGAERNDVVVCSVGEADGEARWRSRYFVPEGRRLPVFDSVGGHRRIIPRAEVGQLIAGS